MAWMRTNGSGITSADMKLQSARPPPIRWRQTMLNSVTIWLDWLASPVVFLAARTLRNVPCVYLSSALTADNSTSNSSQVTLRMSWTSLAHYFRHSLDCKGKHDRSFMVGKGGKWLPITFWSNEIKEFLSVLLDSAKVDRLMPLFGVSLSAAIKRSRVQSAKQTTKCN